MIYSFVNLVSWEYMFNSKKNIPRKMYVDSLTFWLAIFIASGTSKKKCSGIKYLRTFNKKEDSVIYLVAKEDSRYKNSYTLPFFHSKTDFDKVDWSFLSNYKDVVIGISSPKQEMLAEKLYLKYPDKSYYCLGAALYFHSIIKPNFIGFLLQDYKRTKIKISITLKRFTRILLDTEYRQRLASFQTELI